LPPNFFFLFTLLQLYLCFDRYLGEPLG